MRLQFDVDNCIALSNRFSQITFEIGLPYPRTLDMKTHEAFGVYTRRIYRLLGME